MTVKLDLSTKPQKIVSLEERKSNKHVLLFFILALIYISSFLQISLLSYRLFSIKNKITSITSEISSEEGKLALVTKELNELNSSIKERADSINFVLAGLPVPEILFSALSSNKDKVFIECVIAQDSRLIIIGRCTEKNSVSSLIDSLVKNNIVNGKPVAEFSFLKEKNEAGYNFRIEERISDYSEMYEKNSSAVE